MSRLPRAHPTCHHREVGKCARSPASLPPPSLPTPPVTPHAGATTGSPNDNHPGANPGHPVCGTECYEYCDPDGYNCYTECYDYCYWSNDNGTPTRGGGSYSDGSYSDSSH